MLGSFSLHSLFTIRYREVISDFYDSSDRLTEDPDFVDVTTTLNSSIASTYGLNPDFSVSTDVVLESNLDTKTFQINHYLNPLQEVGIGRYYLLPHVVDFSPQLHYIRRFYITFFINLVGCVTHRFDFDALFSTWFISIRWK